MDNLKAVMICEGTEAPESEAQYFEAWQYLINTGLAWSLQGSFGRRAADLIELGYCQSAPRVQADSVTLAQDKKCKEIEAKNALQAIAILRNSKAQASA